MAPPSTPPRRKPMAILDVAEVTRAIEDYVAARRPDISHRLRAHGIKMTESGHFVWELHDERLNGIEVVEVTLQRAS
jgi:hypothetical protein